MMRRPALIKETSQLVAPITAASTTQTLLSALPASVDLSLYAGDDFAFTLTLTDSASQPVDLTGATILSQIRKAAGQPVAAIINGTASSNVITLSITGSETQMLSGGYVWDCQVTYASGAVSTVAAGKATITADVTR